MGTVADPNDRYGDETVVLVEAFQRARGLVITGEVDELTWSRLMEAGWRIGQRLLFLAHPFQRGDDVAELQVRLAQLGFDPGRIDGIFGPLLEHALCDFQRNCGVEVSGTLTRTTLLELLRVTPSSTARNLVNEARDRAGFREGGTGPVVLCGSSPLRPIVESSLRAHHDVVALDTSVVGVIVSFANENNAKLVISLEQLEQLEGVHLHYWASYRSFSRQGEALASAIASALASSNVALRVELTGMALPLLRETKMTTLHIEHGDNTESNLRGLADALSTVLDDVIHR